MGELLDLILDFERKLLALIRDLVVRPQKVAQCIVDKDKQYLGSFKFYSIITSLWVIVIHYGSGLDVFYLPTDYVVPARFQELLKSEQDFAFLIAPFVGMIEYFLPFGIINYFLFRKRQLSFLNHITLNVHLAAILLVYELPFLLIFALIDQFTNGFAGSMPLFSIVFLVIVPIVYYGYVHVKIFANQKVVSFLKPVITVLLVGFLSMTYLLDSPVHEMMHQKIFFHKYQQFDLKPTISADSVSYSRRLLIQSEAAYLTTMWSPNTMKRSNSFVFSEYNNQEYSYINYFLSFDSSDTVQIPLEKKSLFLSVFTLQQMDSSRTQFIVQKYFCDCNDTIYFWTYDELRKHITPKTTFLNYVSTSSQMFLHESNLWFTGVDSKSHRPVLGSFSQNRDSVLSIIPIQDADNFRIDQIHTESTASTSSLSLLVSNIENKRLREIRWIRGNMSDSTFIQSGELVIYKNEFTPTSDLYRSALHNSNYNPITDSTAIVSFQVMTDSSFALNVASINTKSASTNWSAIYTIPADFSFNDVVLADEHSIYVLGRALSVFRKGLSVTNYQLPYVLTIDSKTGLKKNLEFLPFDIEQHLLAPDEMYRFTSSAYQDNESIYWTIGGEVNMLYSYIIKK